jgi:CHAT domain-containing protein
MAIAAMGRGRQVLTGPTATAAAVARAFQGAQIAHLACHGRFRADNPSFSSLQFADGPLYVYDIERLKQPPRVIVLSACDGGRAAVTAGDELRGLIAALIALGTQTVIAATVPVDDEASQTLMIELHRGLLAGVCPASALGQAQEASWSQGSPAEIAAASAFSCFGAGWTVDPGAAIRGRVPDGVGKRVGK